MSWILGAFGPVFPKLQAKLDTITPNPLFRVKEDDLMILAGGIKETCCFHGETTQGWIVCGLGIESDGHGFRFMDIHGWDSHFENRKDTRSLNGQFAGVRYRKGECVLFTDAVGSRDLYYTEVGEAIIFSTRPDWLARISGNCELDTEEFGARWLFFYQLSTKSIIRKIERLGPGAVITINARGITVERTDWQSKSTASEFEDTLNDLVLFPKLEGKKITVGLSGGLDSRLLFSILLHKNIEWDVHTFGPKSHPDALIASQIAKAFNVPHRHFESDPLGDANLESKLADYCAQSLALRPASSFLQLQHYPMLHGENTIVIDGAFGEIARRQMLNRVALRGNRALREKDSQALFPLFARTRADIFSPEIFSGLKNGALRQIESLWSSMPEVENIGTANWLDLLIIRSGLPNVNAAEQARIDHYVPNYMPFVQPSLLDTIFTIPMAQRRGGKLFRQLIVGNERKLSSFPLVFVDCVVPYQFTTVPAYVLRRIKTKLHLVYRDNLLDQFLNQMRPMIEDISRSNSASQSSLCDYKKVRTIVDGYFLGNRSYASQVNWWLGFELWRQALGQAE
jgi:hypothetical protein